MPLIRRRHGDESDEFVFDGSWLVPRDASRSGGCYEASIFYVPGPWVRSSVTVWQFDGERLEAIEGFADPWTLEGEVLRCETLLASRMWHFSGSRLAPASSWENDEWLADSPVPLPVMMRCAGLI